MEQVTPQRVRVSIYSDYTCPWCYLGSYRLEKLKEGLAGDVEIVDTWMPFEIHPEVPAGGMPVDALPYSKEQFREMTAHLRKQAEEEGLAMIDRERLSNTHKALAAATFVQNEHPACFRAFHEGLFEAYFVRGMDVSDMKVLRRLADASGVPPRRIEEVVSSGAYDDAIDATGELARRLGINATPTFVFENEFAVVGAQPVDALRSAVRKVVEGIRKPSQEGAETDT